MTTVVPTSEEDPALFVVRFTSEVSWADAGPEVVESQVKRLCIEAQECIVMGRWLDLASLMLTSADLIFSKVSDKGTTCTNRSFYHSHGDPCKQEGFEHHTSSN
ncbi:hypothetical protein CsSME_00005277 [Camellia sinensis var. sinensis]